jgi:hypothetical protein
MGDSRMIGCARHCTLRSGRGEKAAREIDRGRWSDRVATAVDKADKSACTCIESGPSIRLCSPGFVGLAAVVCAAASAAIHSPLPPQHQEHQPRYFLWSKRSKNVVENHSALPAPSAQLQYILLEGQRGDNYLGSCSRSSLRPVPSTQNIYLQTSSPVLRQAKKMPTSACMTALQTQHPPPK